jgi:predicted RNA-binding Zn ribbon-like protein
MPLALRFPLIDEPIALDLVNTRVREAGADVDLLESPSALDAWLAAEVGRLPWSGTAGAADLDAVRALRGAIAALLTARRANATPPRRALQIVNRALSGPGGTSRLAWTSDGPREIALSARARRAALLRALAMDAVRIVVGPDAELLRTCAHPDCVLQFVARHPRRQWCSATTCGNRARVSRHYLRHRAGA